MPKQVTVRPGDCTSSIAYEHGFFPQTLWDAAENAALKATHDFSTVLAWGETVYIPELKSKQVARKTDARHQFKRRGVPERIRLRFLDEQGKPRAGLAYRFESSAGVRTGATDNDGSLTESILPNEKNATLTLETGGEPEIYELSLGKLQPQSEDEGARARLDQLGCFRDVDADWTDGQRMQDAILVFQALEDLELTGELDDATRGRLKSKFGA